MLLELGNHRFDISTRALVMGILNRTPDSFFDGGEYFGFDEFIVPDFTLRGPVEQRRDGLAAFRAEVIDRL